MQLLCSPRVSLPFLPYWGWYGKVICGASERASPLPAPLRQELTAETSEQAGGQGSLLSDGYFALALIDLRQSPPAVCHILTKWITDKSVKADCSGDLTTSLRPQHSQMTSAWLCVTSPQLRVRAVQLAAQKCVISFGKEKEGVAKRWVSNCTRVGEGG